MKFYEDYITNQNLTSNVIHCQKLQIINKYNCGIISLIEGQLICIQNSIDLNRCFDNDIVDVQIIDTRVSMSTSAMIDLINMKKVIDNEKNIECHETTDDDLFMTSEIEKELVSTINKTMTNENILCGKIINRREYNANIYLTGVLDIKSKYLYGLNKKGVPIYKFHPNDSKYPPFYVASNYLKTFNKLSNSNKFTNNIYVYVKYKHWAINSKYPVGTCEQVIGEIGDINAEYNHLLYDHGLIHKSYRNINTSISMNKLTNKCVDCTNDLLFSVDPLGCKDIDDVIGIKKILDNTSSNILYQISIHISDVDLFVKENSELDRQAYKRGSSVYAPHKQINMLPNELSTDLCSLLPNKKRNAISLIIMTDDMMNIKTHYIQSSVIESKYALDYDIASRLLANKQNNKKIEKKINNMQYPDWIAEDLLLLLDFSIKNKIHTNMYNCDMVMDSHFIIETLMILTNSIIAKELYDNDSISLLRCHKSINNVKNKVQISKANDEKLNNFLNYCSIKSAKYIAKNNDEQHDKQHDKQHNKQRDEQITNNNEIYHDGLGIKYYTHFTSPIRRYFDIIVHRRIKHIYGLYVNVDNNVCESHLNESEFDLCCEHLNHMNKQIKKCERDFRKIEVLFDDTINKHALESYVININENSKTIQLYIPSLNITHTFHIFSNKLSEMFSYDILHDDDDDNNDNNDNNNDKILTITNIQTNVKIEIQLYQRMIIDVIGITNKEFLNKINIKIIEPNIELLL